MQTFHHHVASTCGLGWGARRAARSGAADAVSASACASAPSRRALRLVTAVSATAASAARRPLLQHRRLLTPARPPLQLIISRTQAGECLGLCIRVLAAQALLQIMAFALAVMVGVHRASLAKRMVDSARCEHATRSHCHYPTHRHAPTGPASMRLFQWQPQ